MRLGSLVDDGFVIREDPLTALLDLLGVGIDDSAPVPDRIVCRIYTDLELGRGDGRLARDAARVVRSAPRPSTVYEALPWIIVSTHRCR